MTARATAQSPQTFDINDVKVLRQPVQASMSDGAILHGYIYHSIAVETKSRKKTPSVTTPLLCLASELGNCREHHRFALGLASQPAAKQRIFTLDMRGRGLSQVRRIRKTDVSTDADDLISFCDANNLHHIDMLVSGFSLYALLLAMVKRPGLVRKLVLNDAAPEFEDVALAKHIALVHRIGRPASWEDGAEQLRTLKGQDFPHFADEDWLDMARQVWRDAKGKPALETAKGLMRWSNRTDLGSFQPNLWPAFGMFKTRPVLLVKGEYSSLITDVIAAKMGLFLPSLEVIIAKRQGHVPQLERGHLTDQVLAFLLKA
ncbi:MAG: alpha/beta hydrolase [Rhizobiaceae bacterium]